MLTGLRSANQLLTVDDYRALAKRRLPRVAFDFVDGGAESEQTERENHHAFEQVWLRPQVGTSVGSPDLTVNVLGTNIAMPVILGPTGMARIVHPDGDLAAARAAAKANTIFTLATRSGHSIEEIAETGNERLWFQVYNVSGRASVEDALSRAEKAGYKAIAMTFDTQTGGKRERDLRNGARALLSTNRMRALPYTPQLFLRPRWFLERYRDGLIPTTPNVRAADGTTPQLSTEQREEGVGGERMAVGWADIDWVRDAWHGPILVKGLLTAEDAKRAVDSGVDGIVVSNHGGRQLDCAPPTLAVLPEIVSVAGSHCTVLLDGGIRRGSDVVKALSLGAKAVLIGRPWVYALGAAGQDGIESILSILRSDIARTLQLMGCPGVAALGRSAVKAPAEWFEEVSTAIY
jgi:L-lactate dehydrogenase (cytochrome)